MTKKIYLAGKMSGKPFFNFPAFFEAAAELRNKGWEVFSPAECDIERAGEFWKECPTGSWEELQKLNVPQVNYRECMRVDLNWILDHADAIALLPDWTDSKGARAEKALAECLGLEEMYL